MPDLMTVYRCLLLLMCLLAGVSSPGQDWLLSGSTADGLLRRVITYSEEKPLPAGLAAIERGQWFSGDFRIFVLPDRVILETSKAGARGNLKQLQPGALPFPFEAGIEDGPIILLEQQGTIFTGVSGKVFITIEDRNQDGPDASKDLWRLSQVNHLEASQSDAGQPETIISFGNETVVMRNDVTLSLLDADGDGRVMSGNWFTGGA